MKYGYRKNESFPKLPNKFSEEYVNSVFWQMGIEESIEQFLELERQEFTKYMNQTSYTEDQKNFIRMVRDKLKCRYLMAEKLKLKTAKPIPVRLGPRVKEVKKKPKRTILSGASVEENTDDSGPSSVPDQGPSANVTPQPEPSSTEVPVTEESVAEPSDHATFFNDLVKTLSQSSMPSETTFNALNPGSTSSPTGLDSCQVPSASSALSTTSEALPPAGSSSTEKIKLKTTKIPPSRKRPQADPKTAAKKPTRRRTVPKATDGDPMINNADLSALFTILCQDPTFSTLLSQSNSSEMQNHAVLFEEFVRTFSESFMPSEVNPSDLLQALASFSTTENPPPGPSTSSVPCAAVKSPSKSHASKVSFSGSQRRAPTPATAAMDDDEPIEFEIFEDRQRIFKKASKRYPGHTYLYCFKHFHLNVEDFQIVEVYECVSCVCKIAMEDPEGLGEIVNSAKTIQVLNGRIISEDYDGPGHVCIPQS